MKKILFPVLTLFVLAFGCKKKSTPDPVPEDKFMSLTAASTWNYEQMNNLTAIAGFYTLTSTTRDNSSQRHIRRICAVRPRHPGWTCSDRTDQDDSRHDRHRRGNASSVRIWYGRSDAHR